MHSAIITTIENFESIKGADRIVSAGVSNGSVELARVVVSKDHREGEAGLYFMPDLQLTDEYALNNDLLPRYDEEGNKIGGGYFSKNLRVTAQKFKGVRSEGIWMPLSSTEYAYGHGAANKSLAHHYSLGAEVNSINGHEICHKYINPATKVMIAGNSNKVLKVDVDFPTHRDTAQLIHVISSIPQGAQIFLSEKIHGTSHRKGNVKITKSRKVWQTLLNRLNSNWYPESEYGIVHGTRRVLIWAGKEGFYGSNAFRYAATAAGELNTDEIVYGEIVGYCNGKPVMSPHSTEGYKDLKSKYGAVITYHYGQDPDTCKFYVYNIKQKRNGVWVDIPYAEMMLRAIELGYAYTPAIDVFTYDGNEATLFEKVKKLAEGDSTSVSSTYTDKHLSEGIVIRVEYNDRVDFYKYKSYGFKLLEGIVKEDVVDMEDAS